jgi:tetratricopeptide (TPR) repeat protein
LATGATGDYEQYKKALALIELNARRGALSPEDQRAKALIQARQPRDRREAVRNLEESFARVLPTANERFFLATLLVANGEWERAKVQFAELRRSRDGQNPLFLAYYIEQLVVHNELVEARNALSLLEKEEPDSLRVVGLRARLLKASKKETEARDSLTAYAQRVQKEPAKLLTVARLTDALGFGETAEPMYREAVTKSMDPSPTKIFPLIQHLGRRGKVGEALDLCEPLRGKVQPLYIAELAVNALRDGKGTAEQCKRVVGWVREFKSKAPTEVFYDLVLANIDDLLGDRKASIAGYRAALERDPRNLLALNNLAVLLALEARDFEEANSTIEKALQIAGPDPGLFDSQGIILLARGDHRKAAEVLDQAVRLTPDPASYARLAFAYAKLGEFRAARNALRQADQAGYQPTSLHPLERKTIEEELGKLRSS